MARSDGDRAELTTLWFGGAVALVATAVWVALTARTGTTYHLFPFIVASGVGVMSRLGGPPLRRLEAIAAVVAGLAAVALGWLALVVMDETPSATFVNDQPGGVPGETVIVALLGAAFSLWWVTRRGRSGR